MTTNLSKQETFLSNLASRLGRPRRSGVKPPTWNVKPYAHLYDGKSREDLIEQFITSLQLLNTEVDRLSMEEIPSALERVLKKFKVQFAIFWGDKQLDDLGIPAILSSIGIHQMSWDHSQDKDDLRTFAAQADIGITCADIGLAETGTVVLYNGGERGRLVSLLPPVYLCILKESQIVPRLTQAVQHIHSRIDEGLPACINFITGPSRTADIEMDLALGVHGPGNVHVLLLQD